MSKLGDYSSLNNKDFNVIRESLLNLYNLESS